MIPVWQMMLTWHVYDMKISHVNPEVIESFIDWMRDKYETVKESKVKVSRGKIHDYLGIQIDYTTLGEVKINMTRYIEKMIQEFPFKNELKNGIKTPAGDHLFKVNKRANKLSNKMKDVFHRLCS